MNGFDKFELTARRDELATALTARIVQRKNAEQAEREARAAYEAACVDYGRAHVPEGFAKGDRVKRNSLRRGSYGFGMYSKKTDDKYVTERGVVTLCEGRMNYRNHNPEPGEWFVLSSSGQTAYRMFDKDGVTTWTKDV